MKFVSQSSSRPRYMVASPMTELVIKLGQSRRTHCEQFKQDLVGQCVNPVISLTNVARLHRQHPNLLARWVKKRTEPARMTTSLQPNPP